MTVQVELNVGDAGAPARLELQGAPALADGGCDPAAADVGTLSADVSGFLWNGTYSWSGTDATLQLCTTAFSASDAGLASAQLEVKVDTTPPSVVVLLGRTPTDMSDPSAAFQPAFARDEAPLALSGSQSDGDAGSGIANVIVSVLGSDGGVIGSPLAGPPYSVNLQSLPLQEHGQFTVVATATDNVGNVSAMASQPFAVTRWKWVADTGTNSTIGMPAVDQAGNVYAVVVVVVGTITHNVFAFAPGGSPLWSQSVPGTPNLAPALAGDGGVLFIAQNNGDVSILNAIDGSDAGLVATSTSPVVSMAVGSAVDGLGALTEAAFLNASNSRLYGVETGGATFNQNQGTGATLGGVYADGINAIFSYVNGSSALRELPTDNASPAFGAGTTLASLLEDPTAGQTVGQTYFGPVGTRSVAFFAGALGAGKVGRVDINAAVEQPAAFSLSDSVTSEILIGNAGEAYVSVGANSINQLSLASDGGLVAANGPQTIGGPKGMLLGGGWLYALSSSVSAVSRPSLPDGGWGVLDWQIDLSSSTLGVPASTPNLLCSTQHTALLLVPTSAGRIIAFVIDDPGLDTAAGWPKARRDPMNRANIADTLQSCP